MFVIHCNDSREGANWRALTSLRLVQVNFSFVDHKRFSSFVKPSVEVTLQPGDLFYLPPHWSHHVQALDASG